MIGIFAVIEICKLWRVFIELLGEILITFQSFLKFTQSNPWFFEKPWCFFRNWLWGLTPGSINHQESYFLTGNFLLGLHDFNADKEGVNQFILIEQTSAERLIKIDLEFIDDILTTILFARDGLFDWPLKEVDVKF